MNRDLTIFAEAIQGLILQVNEDGVFIEVISNNEELLHAKKEEVIGKTIHDIMGPMSDLFLNLVTNTLKINIPQNIEYQIPVVSGEIRHFEGRCVPMTDTVDEKRCVVFIARDITQRKKTEEALILSEQRFRSIYQNANTGIAFADKNGVVISANSNFQEILEYTEDELRAKHFKEFTHPEDAAIEHKLILEILEGKRNQYQIEKRYISGTGKVIWTDLSLSVIRNPSDNAPLHFIGVITDISERKVNEKLLSELISTKDKFFSIIAHDLQSPLSGIIGMCDILKNNFDVMDEARRTQVINGLHEGSQNARTLLKNLLEWAQSQSGRIEYKPQTLNLKKVLANTLNLYSNQAIEKSIIIYEHIHESIQVYADINILDTIFRNLINNAVKYSNRNSEIHMYAEQQGDHCVISIKDSGIGMSQELVHQLFKIETKVSTFGTAKEKGTGLGLILCKEFIDKYNGHIWVTSVLGEGSTFFFTVPLENN